MEGRAVNVHDLMGLSHVLPVGRGLRVSGWLCQLLASKSRCHRGEEDHFINSAFIIPRRGRALK